MGVDLISTLESVSHKNHVFPCVIIMPATPLCHLNIHVIRWSAFTLSDLKPVRLVDTQTQTCECEPYKHPHIKLHLHPCSSPPASSTTPYLLLSAWLCEPVALYLFLFSMPSLFLAARVQDGAEVFQERSLVVFRVLCLPKVPGSCLDSWENIGTITW